MRRSHRYLSKTDAATVPNGRGDIKPPTSRDITPCDQRRQALPDADMGLVAVLIALATILTPVAALRRARQPRALTLKRSDWDSAESLACSRFLRAFGQQVREAMPVGRFVRQSGGRRNQAPYPLKQPRGWGTLCIARVRARISHLPPSRAPDSRVPTSIALRDRLYHVYRVVYLDDDGDVRGMLMLEDAAPVDQPEAS